MRSKLRKITLLQAKKIFNYVKTRSFCWKKSLSHVMYVNFYTVFTLLKNWLSYFLRNFFLFFFLFFFFPFFLSEANIIMCGMRCFIFLKNIRQGNGVGKGGGDNTSRKLQNFVVKLLQNFVFLLSKFYLEFFPFFWYCFFI